MARTSKQHLIEVSKISNWLNRIFFHAERQKRQTGAKQGVRERSMQCYISGSPGRALCGGMVQPDSSKYRGQWHICDGDNNPFGMQSCRLELWTIGSLHKIVKGRIRDTLAVVSAEVSSQRLALPHFISRQIVEY